MKPAWMLASTGLKARRGDVDADLTGAGHGLVDVLVAEDVDVAELVEPHRLHPENLACSFPRPSDETDDIIRVSSSSAGWRRY